MNVYHTGSLPNMPGPSVLPEPGVNFGYYYNVLSYHFNIAATFSLMILNYF